VIADDDHAVFALEIDHAVDDCEDERSAHGRRHTTQVHHQTVGRLCHRISLPLRNPPLLGELAVRGRNPAWHGHRISRLISAVWRAPQQHQTHGRADGYACILCV